ncbi:MAG: hypothetical protein NT080_09460 [Spirochaetes bacterium]|nr:hypothetical protein [Spirochaetota bacterium]
MDKKGFIRFFGKLAAAAVQMHREKAVAILEFELKELENIFSLLILGGFVGFPSPPAPIALEILPHMERELTIMLARSDFAHDPLAALMGILEIG